MSNKYLEKIALNALAARTMAKEVGILPSSHSAWKYALRNLRDGRGAALQGKALSEGRAKLGDLGNNAYQATQVADRKVGSKGIEVAGKVDPKGKLATPLAPGGYMRTPMKEGDNLHTHPPMGKDFVKKNTGTFQDPRNLNSPERAGPSGLYPNPRQRMGQLQDVKRKDQLWEEHKATMKAKNGKAWVAEQKSISRNLEAREDPDFGKRRRGGEGATPEQKREIAGKALQARTGLTVSKIPDIAKAKVSEKSLQQRLQDIRTKKRAAKSNQALVNSGFVLGREHFSDLGVASSKHLGRVSSPSVNATSAFKVTKNGPRVVYFDHTPRKAKT